MQICDENERSETNFLFLLSVFALSFAVIKRRKEFIYDGRYSDSSFRPTTKKKKRRNDEDGEM